MVMISACRSGATSAIVGEETFGLPAGMMAGGVRAVVASLWTLADKEATLIVPLFYKNIKRSLDLRNITCNRTAIRYSW